MLTKKEIIDLQERGGVSDTQEMINNGSAWLMEGSVGRYAMDCLRSGACFLSEKVHYDYYGNRIPSIDEVKDGSVGSLPLSSMYWSSIVEEL